MLSSIFITTDTSPSMTHNISTGTLCLLLLLVIYILNNTLSITANNVNAHNNSITPSTTIIIEIHVVNATTPSIIVDTGSNRCRTVVTTITITVVVTITMIAINTIIIIITSARAVITTIANIFPRQAPKGGTLSHLSYWNLLHKILDVAA